LKLNFTPVVVVVDVMQIIAGCLSEEEITGLKEMFKNIDKDNSGTITLEELKHGLAKHGTKLSDTEIQQLMDAVSFVLFFLKTDEVSFPSTNKNTHGSLYYNKSN
jgi:uncharacterized protein YneF (UPF0154 family)